MNVMVNIGWKFVLALGAVAVGTIFAVKMDANAAERVSVRVIEAIKDIELATCGKN